MFDLFSSWKTYRLHETMNIISRLSVTDTHCRDNSVQILISFDWQRTSRLSKPSLRTTTDISIRIRREKQTLLPRCDESWELFLSTFKIVKRTQPCVNSHHSSSYCFPVDRSIDTEWVFRDQTLFIGIYGINLSNKTQKKRNKENYKNIKITVDL